MLRGSEDAAKAKYCDDDITFSFIGFDDFGEMCLQIRTRYVRWHSGNGNPTSDSQYSLTSVVTTDSSGRLTFGETEAGDAPVLNGFGTAAVPESGTFGLSLAGLATLVIVRRFRGQGSPTKS